MNETLIVWVDEKKQPHLLKWDGPIGKQYEADDMGYLGWYGVGQLATLTLYRLEVKVNVVPDGQVKYYDVVEVYKKKVLWMDRRAK